MKVNERYKPESIRLKHHDYSSPGEYFITICTKDKLDFFGEINQDGNVILSEIGKIAERYWLEIPKHFPNVELDIFQIMPNHLHGLIVIVAPVETQDFASINNLENRGKTQNFVSLQCGDNDDFKNKFGPQSKNLGSIIRGFKSAVKKYATMNNLDFQWQPNYYEEIIKNEKHYNEVYTYIESNPQTWDRDRNNPAYRQAGPKNLN